MNTVLIYTWRMQSLLLFSSALLEGYKAQHRFASYIKKKVSKMKLHFRTYKNRDANISERTRRQWLSTCSYFSGWNKIFKKRIQQLLFPPLFLHIDAKSNRHRTQSRGRWSDLFLLRYICDVDSKAKCMLSNPKLHFKQTNKQTSKGRWWAVTDQVTIIVISLVFLPEHMGMFIMDMRPLKLWPVWEWKAKKNPRQNQITVTFLKRAKCFSSSALERKNFAT